MGKCILANGIQKVKQKKVMAFKYGQMVLNMKDSGTMIWLEALADLYSLMVIFILEIGQMIRHMELESTFMLKEQLIKEDGTKISKKDKVEKNGQTVLSMKVSISEEKNTEMEYLSGLMEQNIMENGVIIKCMDMESSTGLMVEFIKVITAMTKNMDKVFTLGQMEECTKEDFQMENNMVKEFTNNKMVNKFTAYG
jgi:hypothetical protein